MDELHVFSIPQQLALRLCNRTASTSIATISLSGPTSLNSEKVLTRDLASSRCPIPSPMQNTYSLNPYLKEYEAASLNPRNRSATDILFLPASWSSSRKRYPSAQATFIKVRPSVTNVPGVGNRSTGQFPVWTRKIFTPMGEAFSLCSSLHAAG